MTENRGSTALLMMDVQNVIVSRYAPEEEMLDPFRRALDAARSHGIPVIFVRVGFRPDAVNVSSRNKMFGRLVGMPDHPQAEQGAQIHASLNARSDEPVVTKVRVSAFAGSDLEVLLRSQGIDTLILSGIATSGVVLSTLREAADKDYKLTVLSDACIDSDPDVHRILIEKIFPVQADVQTVDEWTNKL
ncbi:cysteine hydrolase [Saccharibacillus sp. CPCC 101409]|uniref:cysteine hydrolase family protein n=1 Tax=Saccharibacillus sp. CPCC 101409 TaxID=3058041 RepID=UPI002672AB76|nr:cysteine hydrolase [Saccharibacillus sp. CPCC 101409]MDO3412208.1 cysteine hydrolase [Saccharibacillus sp. CPCC 101409]